LAKHKLENLLAFLMLGDASCYVNVSVQKIIVFAQIITTLT